MNDASFYGAEEEGGKAGERHNHIFITDSIFVSPPPPPFCVCQSKVAGGRMRPFIRGRLLVYAVSPKWIRLLRGGLGCMGRPTIRNPRLIGPSVFLCWLLCPSGSQGFYCIVLTCASGGIEFGKKSAGEKKI